MKCPKCGSEWSDGATFCGNCGKKIPKKSPSNAVKAFLIFLLFALIMITCQALIMSAYSTSVMMKDDRLVSATEKYVELSADSSATPEMLAEAQENCQSAIQQATKTSLDAMLSHTSMLLLIGDLIAILVICLIFRLRHSVPTKELRFRLCNPGRFLTFALLGASLSIVVSSVLSAIPFSEEFINQYNTQFASLTDGGDSTAIKILCTVVVTPIIEEIVFRAIAITRLKPTAGRVPAIIISAVVFAACHFGFSTASLISVAYAFVVGLIFALLFDKYDSILPSMIAHAAFNLVGMFDLGLSPSIRIAVAAASAVICAFCLYRAFFRYPTFSDVLFDSELITPINDEEKRIIERVTEIKNSRDPVNREEADALAQAFDDNRAAYVKEKKNNSSEDR